MPPTPPTPSVHDHHDGHRHYHHHPGDPDADPARHRDRDRVGDGSTTATSRDGKYHGGNNKSGGDADADASFPGKGAGVNASSSSTTTSTTTTTTALAAPTPAAAFAAASASSVGGKELEGEENADEAEAEGGPTTTTTTTTTNAAPPPHHHHRHHFHFQQVDDNVGGNNYSEGLSKENQPGVGCVGKGKGCGGSCRGERSQQQHQDRHQNHHHRQHRIRYNRYRNYYLKTQKQQQQHHHHHHHHPQQEQDEQKDHHDDHHHHHHPQSSNINTANNSNKNKNPFQQLQRILLLDDDGDGGTTLTGSRTNNSGNPNNSNNHRPCPPPPPPPCMLIGLCAVYQTLTYFDVRRKFIDARPFLRFLLAKQQHLHHQQHQLVVSELQETKTKYSNLKHRLIKYHELVVEERTKFRHQLQQQHQQQQQQQRSQKKTSKGKKRKRHDEHAGGQQQQQPHDDGGVPGRGRDGDGSGSDGGRSSSLSTTTTTTLTKSPPKNTLYHHQSPKSQLSIMDTGSSSPSSCSSSPDTRAVFTNMDKKNDDDVVIDNDDDKTVRASNKNNNNNIFDDHGHDGTILLSATTKLTSLAEYNTLEKEVDEQQQQQQQQQQQHRTEEQPDPDQGRRRRRGLDFDFETSTEAAAAAADDAESTVAMTADPTTTAGTRTSTTSDAPEEREDNDEEKEHSHQNQQHYHRNRNHHRNHNRNGQYHSQHNGRADGGGNDDDDDDVVPVINDDNDDDIDTAEEEFWRLQQQEEEDQKDLQAKQRQQHSLPTPMTDDGDNPAAKKKNTPNNENKTVTGTCRTDVIFAGQQDDQISHSLPRVDLDPDQDDVEMEKIDEEQPVHQNFSSKKSHHDPSLSCGEDANIDAYIEKESEVALGEAVTDKLQKQQLQNDDSFPSWTQDSSDAVDSTVPCTQDSGSSTNFPQSLPLTIEFMPSIESPSQNDTQTHAQTQEPEELLQKKRSVVVNQSGPKASDQQASRFENSKSASSKGGSLLDVGVMKPTTDDDHETTTRDEDPVAKKHKPSNDVTTSGIQEKDSKPEFNESNHFENKNDDLQFHDPKVRNSGRINQQRPAGDVREDKILLNISSSRGSGHSNILPEQVTSNSNNKRTEQKFIETEPESQLLLSQSQVVDESQHEFPKSSNRRVTASPQAIHSHRRIEQSDEVKQSRNEKPVKAKNLKSKMKLKTTYPSARKSNWISNAQAKDFVSEESFRPPARLSTSKTKEANVGQRSILPKGRTSINTAQAGTWNPYVKRNDRSTPGSHHLRRPIGNPYEKEDRSRNDSVKEDQFRPFGNTYDKTGIRPTVNPYDQRKGVDDSQFVHNNINRRAQDQQQMFCRPIGEKKITKYDDDDPFFSGDEDDSDDDKNDGPNYPYHEVVRKKSERQKLHGHDCPDCKAFRDLIMSGKGKEVFNEQEIMECTRHRSRFINPRPSSPENFWELSFIDEMEAKKKRQKEEQRDAVRHAWWSKKGSSSSGAAGGGPSNRKK